ncbi:MAG: hypothetical protein HRT71_02515 [Flavobacteriales bacterium]|nr:hypothetical protein [Flavobacteriales bacterium]
MAAGNKTEVVKSYYTTGIPNYVLPNFSHQNTRNRITSVVYHEVDDGSEHDNATHYSYDIHGNVTSLLQDNRTGVDLAADQFKKIEYSYDLLSGNVNEVNYQKDTDTDDEFNHKYTYDTNNRITTVHTSKNGVEWSQDAKYFYNLHGIMYRTELAHNKVQGMDYAYNLQGWLKGVNSNTVMAARDQGKDGDLTNGGLHSQIGRDAIGFSLAYHANDYKQIGTEPAGAENFTANISGTSYLEIEALDLYNGNIAHMVTAFKGIDESSLNLPQLTAYRYDQLNRIKSMLVHQQTQSDVALNTWSSVAGNNDYKADYSYDANGNLTELNRNGFTPAGAPNSTMDQLRYHYQNTTNGYKQNTNRLVGVNDLVLFEGGSTEETTYFDDVESQEYVEQNDQTANYKYDGIGNLIKDKAVGIENIEWTVTGKVKSISRIAGSTDVNLEFVYDAMGNRIAKIVKPQGSTPNQWITTHYVRDASGNVMATYIDNESNDLQPQDYHVYGTKRVAIANKVDPIYDVQANVIEFTSGNKSFELTNHLGNVLATVSDLRIGFDAAYEYVGDEGTHVFRQTASQTSYESSADGTYTTVAPDGEISEYAAHIVSMQDYYPGGSAQPSRTFSASDYRYGFNGQEKVDEISGNGNHNTALYWEYDTRLMRRWNQDPKPNPSISNYATFANNPIMYSDHLGDTLDVKQNLQSTTDITSLVRSGNEQYLQFNSDKSLTLNFGGLNDLDQIDLIAGDEGLSLLNDMINSDKKMLYEASEIALLKNGAGVKSNLILY